MMQPTHEESAPLTTAAASVGLASAEATRALPRALRRVVQFGGALSVRSSQVDDARYRRLIGEDAWQVAHRLTAFDRQHHLAVHDWLVARGVADSDLLQAALLHDVGKATGPRIHAMHRAVHVLAARCGASQLALRHAVGLRAGLRVLHSHPQLGAEVAAAAGASTRTCALIAQHHDDRMLACADAQALRLLQEADDAVGA